MDDRTKQIMSQYLGMPVEDVDNENESALTGEITMCDKCIEKTDRAMAEIVAVAQDDTISKGMRFGYVMAAAAEALAQSSHGQLPVSEIFGTLYGVAKARETVGQLDSIMEMIFGKPGSRDN